MLVLPVQQLLPLPVFPLPQTVPASGLGLYQIPEILRS